MLIRPYGRLEDWKPMELLNRAKYLYEADASKENLLRLQELLSQFAVSIPEAFLRGAGEPIHSEEQSYFCDEYPLSVVPHLRYSATPWHSHNFYELIYVLGGTCEHTLKSGTMVMEKGDFCILPPNQLHRISSYADEALIVNILIRKSTFVQSFQPLLKDFGVLSTFFSHTLFQKENSAYLLFQCGDDPVISTLIRKMYEEYVSYTPFSPAILVGQLMQLLGEVMRSHHMDTVQLSGSGANQPTRVSAMLQYMEDHLRTVTLQELARQFSYSNARCSTIIKEATGKNFTQILREHKIYRAARLLQEDDRSMLQIAKEVGFCDTSHFYKAFSAVYGMTPAQYKKTLHPSEV